MGLRGGVSGRGRAWLKSVCNRWGVGVAVSTSDVSSPAATSIFALKEIQLQKETGLRSASLPDSGEGSGTVGPPLDPQ